MTPADLALLVELGLAIYSEDDLQGRQVYHLTHAGRVMAGEKASAPPVQHSQQWRDGQQARAAKQHLRAIK